MKKKLEIKVYGHIFGIGFRFSSYEKFVELGLTGTAMNEPVEQVVKIEVEGEEEPLKKFVEWCYVGPSGAQVAKVEVVEKV